MKKRVRVDLRFISKCFDQDAESAIAQQFPQHQQRINVILDITDEEIETDSVHVQFSKPGVPH